MRNPIRKILASVGAGLLALAPLSALAVGLPDVRGPAEEAASGLPGTGGEGSLVEFVGSIISAVLGVLGIVLLVLLIYAGFLWMTAQGDMAKVDKAKSILISAVIGLAIVMSAYAISFYVLDVITASTGVG